MKTSIFVLLLISVFATASGQKSGHDDSVFFLVGTYTNEKSDNGVFVYSFNPNSGDCELKSKISGEENPSFLAFSRNGKYVYVVNEVKNGKISSYAFNGKTGQLWLQNRVSSGGDSPCYVETDHEGKYIFAGNYGSGTLSAVSVKPDGSLKEDIQIIQHQGKSVDKNRQTGPHVHATVLAPDKKFLLVTDLGTDRINIYAYDFLKLSHPLIPAKPPFAEAEPGSGPRHLAFHPDRKYVYLVQELNAEITAFDYRDGELKEKQTISMLPEGFKGNVGAADIHVSPDGKFVYASNRGDANDIAIYSVLEDGTLKHIGNQTTLGKSPRNFAIDPSGKFLLAANQASNEIVVFTRDEVTGMLTPLDKRIEVPRPVCIKFAPER